MNKKYKILLTIILTLLVICFCIFAMKKFVYDKDPTRKPKVSSSVVDNMESYGYSLKDRDTKLFKEKYYELKDILEAEEIDYQKYAENLSQLFLIDLFTISNKLSKYDVGGLDYLYEDEKEMFKNKVMDTLYEQVEDNSYNTRNQKLPTVSDIEIEKIEETKYKIEDKQLLAYKTNIKLTYQEDLGYDKDCEVIVVQEDKNMYVVKYTAIN